METRLRLCFNAVNVDPIALSASIRALRTPDDPDDPNFQLEKKEARSYVLGVYRSLLSETPVMEAISDDIRSKIDDAFKKHLTSDGVVESFAQDVDAWNSAFAVYSDDVVAKLHAVVRDLKASNRLAMSTDAVKRAYETCASKAQLVLYVRDVSVPFSRFPFMSAGVWNALVDNFKQVSASLVEVRRSRFLSLSLSIRRRPSKSPQIVHTVCLRCFRATSVSLSSRSFRSCADCPPHPGLCVVQSADISQEDRRKGLDRRFRDGRARARVVCSPGRHEERVQGRPRSREYAFLDHSASSHPPTPSLVRVSS